MVTQSERADAPPFVGERARWRAVSIPSEHGGWGLTFEPILLGLLVSFSWSGVAIGAAAVLAFLVRSPLKLALGDRRRHRWLPRSRLAAEVALGEFALLAVFGVAAVVVAGFSWLVPVLAALPLFAVELWFDIRSRGRRLLPELCGGVGIASVAAAIVVAGNGPGALAAALWLIVAARAVASIPFARTQVARLHGRPVRVAVSDGFQAVGVLVAVGAVVTDWRVVAGTVTVAVAAALQLMWVRRPVPPAKKLGLVQLAVGLTVVAATAAGVLAT
jgi:YwiC-like protein